MKTQKKKTKDFIEYWAMIDPKDCPILKTFSGADKSPSQSKKKRKKRKISLASGRKGRMKSTEKAKHKSG